MANHTLERDDRYAAVKAVASMIDAPAAIVGGDSAIIWSNASWRDVTDGLPERTGSDTLEWCLRGFDGLEWLLAALDDSSALDHGEVELCLAESLLFEDRSGVEYTVRWQRTEAPSGPGSAAIVVLHRSQPKESCEAGSDSQRVRIDRLMVRQTLIEEAERVRLGRELHDTVVQELVLARVKIAERIGKGLDPSAAIASIDRIIEQIRTLSFELSPPVLEDFGLIPALHWLSDHLKSRYGADISIVDNGGSPSLSAESRTVLFRAVRELAINAVKHGAGAEIIITCMTYPTTVRVRVRDYGGGFDVSGSNRFGAGRPGYGLLSVEQQVRGIGGVFDLVSEIGEGTRATITLPLERGEDGLDGD